MEGDKFEVVKVRPERAHHLFQRVEGLLRVDVLLVHLIGEQDEALCLAEFDQLDEVVPAESVANGVPRVDDNERLGRQPLGAPRRHHPPQLRHIQPPPLVLVHLVAELLAREERHRRRVDRVLRDRDEDRIRRLGDERLEDAEDRCGCPRREEDVVGVGGEAVALLDELRDVLADELDALAVRVRARAPPHVRLELGGACEDVGLEELERFRVLQESHVVHQRHHLAVEGDGLLPDGVRVADVAVKHLLEGKRLVPLGDHLRDFVCRLRDRSTHRVLHRLDGIIDCVERQHLARHLCV
mmetsp:Transcript_32309/g.76768  ORF Transcript_32309/g.76768 Transcript_32309/m.76768 type:complete len:298 (-) Transcript_32309:36-929(-)